MKLRLRDENVQQPDRFVGIASVTLVQLEPVARYVEKHNEAITQAGVHQFRFGIGDQRRNLYIRGRDAFLRTGRRLCCSGWFVSVRIGFGLLRNGLPSLLVYLDREGRTSELLESFGTLYAVPSSDGRHVAFPRQTSSTNAWLVRGL